MNYMSPLHTKTHEHTLTPTSPEMPPEDPPTADDGYTKVLQGRYELGRILGRGGSSKVYRARDVRTGRSVAVKAVRKPHLGFAASAADVTDAAQARRAVEREVTALRRLGGHPHIVRLLDVLATRSTVYLVLELARGGSLLAALDARGRADERTARRHFRQLASALAHAHARGVFHRDVKPDNLLLDEKGDVRLADFGLCTFVANGPAATVCGSPSHVAPEIIHKKAYDAGMTDVWSCGVVLFALTAGYLPFNDSNLMAMYRKICSGKFRCPKWCSPELRCLLGRMLDTERNRRIKIGEVFDHPWLQQDGLSATMQVGSPVPDMVKWETELEECTEMNAFDIISFASGCDLSGLIGPLQDRVRFVVLGQAELVFGRVAELGQEERLVVRRKGKIGYSGVVLEKPDGKFVAKFRVYRLIGEMLIVEAERVSESEISQFWKRVQLFLSS